MADQQTNGVVKNQDAELANVDMSGALAVTGVLTATGGVVGAITGDITGNIVGEHRHSTQELTATGAFTLNSGVLLLNHATVIIEATLDAPVAGDEVYIIDNSASGTAAHTVTLGSGVTYDGTNNTATLNAPDESLHLVAISATRWFINVNNGSVALSSV